MNDAANQLKDVANVKAMLADPNQGLRRALRLRDPPRLHPHRARRREARLDLLHPTLADLAEHFERHRDIAWVVDRVLRKHGKGIVSKQFASRRIADLLVDLSVKAPVLSRVNAALDARGEEASARKRPDPREPPAGGRERRRPREGARGRRVRAGRVPLGPGVADVKRLSRRAGSSRCRPPVPFAPVRRLRDPALAQALTTSCSSGLKLHQERV
jgi:hypothetical protein